jgi:hypothetical protein
MLRRRVHALLGPDCDGEAARAIAEQVWERRPRHYADGLSLGRLAA